jgi:hypothetical protein
LETFLLCFYFWQTSTQSCVISLAAVSQRQDKVLEMQKVILFHSSPYVSVLLELKKTHDFLFDNNCPAPPFPSSPVHALLIKVIIGRFKEASSILV